jgi:Natural resistance-associated macrophage protein
MWVRNDHVTRLGIYLVLPAEMFHLTGPRRPWPTRREICEGVSMSPPDATQQSAGGMTDPNADLDALPVLAARIARYRRVRPPARKGLLGRLGPGLITGASDDDPSGIATYSQTGAQFGYAMCWVMLFCFPLMVAIQEISARIGRVTGQGITGNIRAHYSRWLLYPIVALLLIANTINLGADLGAMAAALKLLIGGPTGVSPVSRSAARAWRCSPATSAMYPS